MFFQNFIFKFYKLNKNKNNMYACVVFFEKHSVDLFTYTFFSESLKNKIIITCSFPRGKKKQKNDSEEKL